MKRFLLFILLALGGVLSAQAQQHPDALVLSTCGTLPAGVTYTAGQHGILTMNTAGELCNSSSGGNVTASGTFTAGDLIAGGSGSTQIQDTSALASSPGYAALPTGLFISKNITFSGTSSAANSDLWVFSTAGGTCADTVSCILNRITSSSLTTDSSAASNGLYVLFENANVATGAKGNQTLKWANLTISSQPSGNGNYVSSVNQTITGAVAASSGNSSIWSATNYAEIHNTGYFGLHGLEQDIASTAAYDHMLGMYVILETANTTAATNDNTAFMAGAQTSATPTITCLLCVGATSLSGNPLAAGATIISNHSATNPVTITNGIDFQKFTFSGFAFAGSNSQDTLFQVGNNHIFAVQEVGQGAKFRVLGASAAVTARLDVQPGTGTTGGVTLSQSGTGTGGFAISNGTNPLILGGSSGIVEIGTTGAFTANGAVATAMSSVGPTGSHTTIQKWLTITESDGSTVGYIPVF